MARNQIALKRKNRRSIYSWKQRKQMVARSHSEKNNKQKGIWVVWCIQHGNTNFKSPLFHTVRVGYPRTKREALRGCPYCHA